MCISNGHLSDGDIPRNYFRNNCPEGSGRSYSVMNLDSDAEYSFKDHFLINLEDGFGDCTLGASVRRIHYKLAVK